MAINFPDSPTPNDTFTDGGRTWIWDGTTWKIYSSTASGIGLNNFSVTTNSVGTSALSYNNTTGVFTYTPPDLSGYLTQQYTLPTASTTVLGGVKVDGSTITINGSGVISGANTYSLPIATTTVLGGVKIDGTTINYPRGPSAYYFTDFTDKENLQFYNIFDLGIHAGLSFYLTQGLKLGTRVTHSLLDITNQRYDHSFTDLNSDGSYILKDDKDYNFGIQIFIGLQF